MGLKSVLRIVFATAFLLPAFACADDGKFDMARWESILDGVRSRAAAENISQEIIDDTLRLPVFVPSIVKSDRNQSEFKLTLQQYLDRTVSQTRIQKNGGKIPNNAVAGGKCIWCAITCYISVLGAGIELWRS